ncbi:MAG TPA: hypothetical protein PLP23_22230 [Panacibacter sp.]|nr:hypothetical protein [Panacibacter sp.]
MKNEKILFRKKYTIILLFILFNACDPAYDPELMIPDGHGSGYNLTSLGCLRNGPWEVDQYSNRFNETIFLNGKEISSKGYPYTALQKDLVFDLEKGGNISFWLKSEIGSTTDTVINKRDTIVTGRPHNETQLNKVYTTGFWKANFNDSTLLLNFGTRLPEIKFRYSHLGSSSADFQKIYFFDSVYNGERVTLKKVITVHYEHPYIKF